MKKLLIAILAFLNVTFSTGAVIHWHYCMGKLAGWGLGYDQANACAKCGMDEGELEGASCCQDQHTYVKNENDQKSPESFLFFTFPGNDYCTRNDLDHTSPIIISRSEVNPASNAPPRWGVIDIYLFKRTLLI